MTKRKKINLSIVFLLFAACLAILINESAAAEAVQQTGVTMDVRAGFDSYCQETAWMPVRVTVENNGPDLDGEIIIPMAGTSGGENTYAYHIVLPAGSRKEVTLYVTPVGYVRNLDVNLVVDSKIISSVTQTLDCLGDADMLYGVLAGNPSAYTILNDLDPVVGRGVVAQLDLGDIPENSRGLEALDVLVVSDIDTGALSQAQRQAIANWTAAGGNLIVTGGLSWQKTAAGLEGLLPYQPEGTGEEADIELLGVFAGLSLYPQGTAVAASGTLIDGAKSLQDSNGTVVAAWQSQGSGMVFYLTVDPSLEPLKGWDGMLDVYRNMLASSTAQAGWSTGFKDWYQASEAATTLPGLTLPSVLMICGFLAAYVVIIGPLNYFILVRLKKRELAWISIPMVVLFFSGCAVIIGLMNRGGGAVLNRLAVVRGYPGSEVAQVDGVVGLYSPNRGTYDLILGNQFLAHPVPESYNFTGDDWTILSDNDAIHLPKLRVNVGEIKQFAVEGVIEAPKFSHTLKLVPKGDQLLLEGTITNESGVDLTDAILMAPGQVFRLGNFRSGDTQEISIVLDRSERATDQQHTFYSTSSSSASPSGYAYYYGYDTTVNDLVGNYSYYDNPVYYRRFALVSALLNNQNSSVSGRGGGIYLAGWSDESPLEIESESNKRFSTTDTTLYLMNLKPELIQSQGDLVLSPPMFVWKQLETTSYNEVGPYDTYLTMGRYTIQFNLSQPVIYSGVKSLTFHFASSTIRRATDLKVYLWDYTTQGFVRLDIAQFGDFEIADPQKYVGPSGAIIMQMDSYGLPSDGQLERTDFTLVVEP